MITYAKLKYSTCDGTMISQKFNFDRVCMESFASRVLPLCKKESKRSKENLFLADRNSLSKKQMYAVKKFQFEQKIETRCEGGKIPS